MPENIELSIVMPCLNEAETLAICIKKAISYLKKHNINGEIIIADNGSTDGSKKIAKDLNATIVSIQDKGYGNALKGGFKAAKGTYIIMADADDSYDFSNLQLFVEQLRNGFDLVMGNRFKGEIKKGAMPFSHKYLGNPVLSFLGRLFFKIKIGDFHCGLRGFKRSAFENIKLTTTGMEFASEMIVKAKLNKLLITEVPTILSPDGRTRPPHLNTWRDGWRHLRFLLLYSPKWLFLIPGILLMLVGLLLSTFLIAEPLRVNNITLDVHTLLYTSSTILIGFQFIIFYGLTKIFAVENGLLPKTKRYTTIFKYVNLETGIIAGIILLTFGIYRSFEATSAWHSLKSSGLTNKDLFKIVVPAIISIQLGVQIVLFSFFFSLLGLRNQDKA